MKFTAYSCESCGTDCFVDFLYAGTTENKMSQGTGTGMGSDYNTSGTGTGTGTGGSTMEKIKQHIPGAFMGCVVLHTTLFLHFSFLFFHQES